MKFSFSKVLNIVIFVLIVGAFVYMTVSSRDETTVYAEDTIIEHSVIIKDGERIVVQNAATLSIQGDLTIEGRLDCLNGPLTVITTGTITASGEITCNRARELYPSDPHYGIQLVAIEGFRFSPEVILATNSHVQLMVNPGDVLSTKEAMQQKYDELALDIGEGIRVGPFVPIPLAEGQEATLLPEGNDSLPEDTSLISRLTSPVYAADDAPLSEGGSFDYDSANHISGRFIVGDPSSSISNRISVPVPPKEVNNVLIMLDFADQAVVLEDLDIMSTDGRPGESDLNRDCDVRGRDGYHASRIGVFADAITVRNVEIVLGDGGKGGDAETLRDCSPGIARGGAGGAPGNIKLLAERIFYIEGDLSLIPGKAGSGGSAVAHGIGAEASCPANPGGDALAYGGIGANNKMGLKLAGTDMINGIDRITIGELVAGGGGSATANGGKGSDASSCGCDGGIGGNASAFGGNGGTATSRTVDSIGGNGGKVSAVPGDGGSGGSCGSDEVGGNGGNGGAAEVLVGIGGTGRTENGKPGEVIKRVGGNGGLGGNGCGPGIGGVGGVGVPQGQNGEAGINLCGQSVTIPQANSQSEEIEEVLVEDATPILPSLVISPPALSARHTIFSTECPQSLGTLSLAGAQGYNWELVGESPIWLDLSSPDGVVPLPYELEVSFNCNINTIDSHIEQASLLFQQVNTDADPVQIPVIIEIVNPNDIEE